MASLLDSIQKSSIHDVFDNVHDTFKRDIYIYVTEEETFIDTDGNHNPLYGDSEQRRRTKEAEQYTKGARIKYMGEQDRIYGVGVGSQIGISFPNGGIRLKVDEETYNLIKKAKKIRVDDRLCELVSSPSRPGPFNPNYWTIYLKQLT